MIYLDANATTPLDPRVLATVTDELQAVGNASSAHVVGRRANAVVQAARRDVAALVGAEPTELVFTSGSTEANNLAIFGLQSENGRGGVVCPATEHVAVLEPVGQLSAAGRPVMILPVGSDGLVDLDVLAEHIGPSTLLVSVMAVNNETGVRAQLPAIAERVHRAGALLHTDATQLLTWGPVDVDDLGVDLLSLSAHKMHGPVGAGALYIRDEIRHRIRPRVYGGAHETGLRSGTLNTPGIAGLGHAARLAADEGTNAAAKTAVLRDDLAARLAAIAGPVAVHGSSVPRAAGTLNVALLGAPADQVLAGCPDIAASRGSACSGGSEQPSHVLTAMGVPLEVIECSMRLSLHRGTTAAEVVTAADLLARSAARVRARQPEKQNGSPVLAGGAVR